MCLLYPEKQLETRDAGANFRSIEDSGFLSLRLCECLAEAIN
jgi:hypothetical protein